MAAMTVALFLGWWLVTASEAQQLHRPSLSLHPSQAVSMGENVTLCCHLPRMATWVQLWHNESLRFNKEKDKEQDAAEFSFAVTNLEDAGTYQCRYQVSKPLRTSKKSDPVELVLTGVTPEMPESVQLQGPSRDSEDLTYTEMPAAIPCSQPPTSPTAPQSPVIYTTVSTDLPR
ncbi:leukocyte immunoglobulin-like receptor subfamily A member 4 isoform X4 [Gallus gallus]|uniref:leukocyte immunoglobulin-like receptor subfamily A member 4 isoform X4 n=1 Tax=Gallus gallus TaxID=9031 RepID=UPI001AE1FDA2|nr:leukocyte immunoglobulin-like receptor subfamily A member 4 isoform X4 [Gallus gallus]